ncbi:MAG: hypothetical protein ETSY1_08485, partial [Candidatus Entotheonella factor]
MMFRVWTRQAILFLSLVTALWISIALPVVAQEVNEPRFDQEGNLLRPGVGYREWIYVGTPLTPNDMNGGKAPFPEFHTVYIRPSDWAHYKKTGTFRDGTMLVKELISVGSKVATSGQGYFMGEFIGLEATIKSAKRFPNEPGNWAYFSFTPEGSPMMSEEWKPHGGLSKTNHPPFQLLYARLAIRLLPQKTWSSPGV